MGEGGHGPGPVRDLREQAAEVVFVGDGLGRRVGDGRNPPHIIGNLSKLLITNG